MDNYLRLNPPATNTKKQVSLREYFRQPNDMTCCVNIGTNKGAQHSFVFF